MSVLEKEIQSLQQTIPTLAKKIDQLGLMRLLLLCLGVLLGLAGILDRNRFFILISLAFLIGFWAKVREQNQCKQELAYQQAHLQLDQQRLQRRQGHWATSEVQADDKQVAYFTDLDVFTAHGLYDFFLFSDADNTKKALKQFLQSPLQTEKEIIQRQQLMQELSSHPVVQRYLIEEKRLSAEQKKACLHISSLAPLPSYLKWLTISYPLLMATSLVMRQWQLMSILWLIGVLVCRLHFRLFDRAARQADQLVGLSLAFEKRAQVIVTATFWHPELIEMQQSLAAWLARQHHLKAIQQCLKLRFQPFLFLFLDGFCFYEGWLYWLVSRCALEKQLLDIEAILGRFGGLCCLAQWFLIKDRTVFPTVKESLQAEDLRHPLLKHEDAVGASFVLQSGQPVVITGSNMSGKTTFMRNIGLNLVLFYCGLSVDADAFTAPILTLLTSLRTTDQLSEGMSSFYAELQRIKQMIDFQKSGQPALYLIDEIFKGTHMQDRIIGAYAVMETLSYPGAFLLVTTHDEQICHHPSLTVRCLYFQENAQKQHITFDYQLHEGIAPSHNGTFLMKMIGLLE